MQINDIFVIFEQIPVYLWIIIGFVIVLLFSDRKKWDEKVKFNGQDNLGSGYIEVDCYKRKGMIITADLNINDEFSNQPIEIFIKNALGHTIPSKKTKYGIVKYKNSCELTRPKKGDLVEVKINDKTILSGNIR